VNVTTLQGRRPNDPVGRLHHVQRFAQPVAGILPKGVIGTVTNNTATKQIELVISNIAPLLDWRYQRGIVASTNWSVAGVPVFDQGAACGSTTRVCSRILWSSWSPGGGRG
jgi:hypothetical protein